jgi:GNAT superfamily N-acetyltransferase
MSESIIVRMAEPDEVHLVYALMRAGFAESAEHPNPSSALRETLEDVRARIRKGGAILAFEHGRLAGSGRFVVDREAGCLSYERLAVHPALRGRRIGSAMVSFLEDHARTLGLREVRADARSQQPDNRPFYLAHGYRIIGYAERYGIPDMRTHMAKTL